MHIVYCSDRYWPASGGAETYVRNIAQEMAKDHQVKVITLMRGDYSLVEALTKSSNHATHLTNRDGLVQVTTLDISLVRRALSHILRLERQAHQVFRRRYYLIRSLWLRYAAHLLKESLKNELEGADVIHSIAPWELAHSVNLVRRNIPHVSTGLLHSGYWADDVYSLNHYSACSHIVALLNVERQAYLRAGIDEDRISVIGVPVVDPIKQHSTSYIDSKFDRNKPVVLFLGVKREYKGIDILLDATTHIWNAVPNTQFLIVGPKTEYSKKLLLGKPKDSHIIELDTVSEADKWSLLRQCDLVCLPSETEIMPNVILETWSMSKPVVVSNIPTLQEFVGDAGYCVSRNAQDLSQAIIHLLKDPDLSRNLGRIGLEKCRGKHSCTYVKSQLENVYHHVLARNSNGVAK